jgi:thimet oligopeptidase
MKLVETTLGVRYERVQDVALWHEDVRAYTVRDVASGKALGALYVDMYPRDGKYNHAAVWPIRGSAPGKGRVSQAALVVNFNRQGLTLDELVTLLHEFGHSVHVNLSATRYSGHAGTSVVRDFVEAPSQMLEDWAFDKGFLGLYQQVCNTCKAVPDGLLEQAVAAHHYGTGVFAARQRLYAAYDLTLYDGSEPDPLALWSRMEGATPVGTVPGSLFPAGFGHIAGGYAAGYYGYLWSLVLAVDMRTAFGANKLDPQVGMRYRRSVLAQGAQRPPRELVREFLGRDFNAQAFYAELKK